MATWVSTNKLKQFAAAIKNTFAPLNHRHSAFTLQTNGTVAASYDGSVAKTVNITPASIGLGSVNNTADSTKSVNYAISSGKATNDNKGNPITGYVSGLSVSGKTVTYTRGDGTTGTIITQDTNTTYGIMGGASTSAGGSSGLVPAPSAGAATRYLRSDGTWSVPPDNNTTYSAGAGISIAGTTFSNSGVRGITTGTENGTISVNINGTSANVSIKGLGSAAYTPSTTYAAAGHTHNYAGSSNVGGAATSALMCTGNASTATKLATSRSIGITGGATGTATGFDGSGNISIPVTSVDAAYISGYQNSTYMNTHPESGNTSILPFIYNDLAHFIQRGGQMTSYYTAATDFTSVTLNNTGNVSIDKTAPFDGSPSYACFSVASTSSVVVIDLSLPENFAYSTNFYIDFGSWSWSAKNVQVLIWNSSSENQNQKYSNAWNGTISVPRLSFGLSYSFKSTVTGNTIQGFNRIRIVLTNFVGTTPRIAQIGVINYGSAGVRKTYMSRGIDDGIYRSITPATSNVYNLGSSENKWANVYATQFVGTLSGNASSATALTSSAGSATQPVYFSGGKPVATTYTLGKSVPSNAVFTDTNTWRGIQNVLTSDSTTESLSAAQGKALKTLVDAKASTAVASTSAAGLMSASDKAKIDGITASADAVNFTRSLTSGTKVGTITINGTGTDLYCQTNTDTHWTTGLVVGASSTATANAAAGNGNVYLNAMDNTTVRGSHKIAGSGATSVTSDANGVITISSTNTTYGTATTSTSGLMTASMVSKLDGIASGAQVNSITGVKGNSETSYRTGNVNITAANIGLGNVNNTADADKSVKYASSASSATALTSSAGSATQPVYFSGGKPVATTYTLGKSVPSNAVFTDTNTWRGIQNSLASDSVTDSLSAAQGKVLKALVDGKSDSGHTHKYAGSDTAGGSAYVANVIRGTYTGNGGGQGPGYFGVNTVGSLMMNTTVNGDGGYKNWIIMDPYNGSDVGGATAIGVSRGAAKAFIMQSDAARTAWNNSTELLSVANYNSYAPSKTGAGASGTWGINITGSAGYANSAGSVAWGNVSGKPSTYPPSGHSHDYLPTSSSCNKNWSWSGQGGQPNWVWGGNDGWNMYVYNPSNFNVNYASNAGYAENSNNANNATAALYARNSETAGSAYYINTTMLRLGTTPNDGGRGGISNDGGACVNALCSQLQARNLVNTGWVPMYASGFGQQSSRKYKHDILPMTDAQATAILDMEPVSYLYNEDQGIDGTQYGMIAEDLAEIQDQGLLRDSENQPNGIDYSKFTPQLIKLCQIQQDEINTLKAKVETIEARMCG